MAVFLSPSLLSCDFSRLGEEAIQMEQAGADFLHIDVMDGMFVPNLTLGAPVIRKLRPVTALPFDAHLMIINPLKYIDDFADAGCDWITFHLESQSDIGQTIDRIHRRGKKAGLSIKPGTPAEKAFPYLKELDLLLVMSVEPGFGNQTFLESALPKLAALREEVERVHSSLLLSVDGGINLKTAPLAVQAGAQILAAGSALFRAPYTEALAQMRASVL